MFSDSYRVFARTYGTLLARILIGALFVISGVGKISMFAGVASYIESAGLPMGEVLAALAIVIEVGGGLMLATGFYIDIASKALIIFTALAAAFFHHPGLWADAPAQQAMFLKDLAIAGGLIYIFAYGPGDGWSLSRTR